MPASKKDENGSYPVFGGNGIIGYSNDFLVDGDYILTGRVGTIGEVTFFSGKCWISDNTLYISSSNIDAIKFLYYYLGNIDFTYLNVGSTQPLIKQSDMKKLIFPFPQLSELQSIAYILSKLDSKIELNQQMNKTLEAIGQALFKHWFIDFEFPNEEGKPYKSSGGEMVDSEMGEIPKGWIVGSIYEISEIVYGAPFSSKMFNKEKKGLPLIRIRDLKDSNPEFYTTEQHPKATVICPGDIIAGMDAEFRPHIWLGEKSYLNQRLCYFKPRNNIHRYFILNTIRPLLSFFENAKVGTTVIHLGKSDIDTWKVIIPTDQVNRKFSMIINGIFNQTVNNSLENRTLSTIRDSLLPKLMSGKIRVPVDNYA